MREKYLSQLVKSHPGKRSLQFFIPEVAKRSSLMAEQETNDPAAGVTVLSEVAVTTSKLITTDLITTVAKELIKKTTAAANETSTKLINTTKKLVNTTAAPTASLDTTVVPTTASVSHFRAE